MYLSSIYNYLHALASLLAFTDVTLPENSRALPFNTCEDKRLDDTSYCFATLLLPHSIGLEHRKLPERLLQAVMSDNVGDKALSGDTEWISNYCFEIGEHMTMTFEGRSCNITQGNGDLVEKLDSTNGQATRDVYAGYRCYVMRAWVKLEKTN